VVWIKKHFWEIALVILLFTIGFYFRLKGISTNHSFWSDEAFTSAIARDILIGKTSFTNGISVLEYQRMQIISNLISFKLFGLSEWSARIPSVLWGSLGIVFAYLLAKRHSNRGGGFLAAFLFTFLQLNLAHSTQAKPYAAIETLLLATIYFVDKNIVLAIALAILATLFNYLGIVAFIPVVIHFCKYLVEIKKKPVVILALSIFMISLFWILRLDKMLLLLTRANYNWTTYLRELFWRQFSFITLPAIFGLFLIKNKKALFGILLTALALIFSWNFISYSRNLRYLMPIFGLLLVLFGIFWGKVGEILSKKSTLACVFVSLLIFAGGYKIVRKPATYYTPNADFFADVQNADYKHFFKLVYEKFPDFDTQVVYADMYDYMSWYTHKIPNAILSKGYEETKNYPYINVPAYSSLQLFKGDIRKNPKGFLIVEDWQSYTPDDIKEYAKRNLKLEIRVESMSVSPNDKWPLELYSWGFEKNK